LPTTTSTTTAKTFAKLFKIAHLLFVNTEQTKNLFMTLSMSEKYVAA